MGVCGPSIDPQVVASPDNQDPNRVPPCAVAAAFCFLFSLRFDAEKRLPGSSGPLPFWGSLGSKGP